MSEARDEHGPADGNGVEAYPFPHPLGSGIRYCARCLCGWTATPYNTERSAIDALNDHIEDGYRDIEHRPKIQNGLDDGLTRYRSGRVSVWRGECKCGWVTPYVDHADQAQMEMRKHFEQWTTTEDQEETTDDVRQKVIECLEDPEVLALLLGRLEALKAEMVPPLLWKGFPTTPYGGPAPVSFGATGSGGAGSGTHVLGGSAGGGVGGGMPVVFDMRIPRGEAFIVPNVVWGQGPAPEPIAGSPAPRPLMKWAGGKTQLLPRLAAAAPAQYGRYIEPFVGGGALFFHLRPERAVIADSNGELVSMYRAVAADPDAVFAVLQSMRNTEEFFYEVRALEWSTMTPAEAAARTLFLNRTCFNGLYRVNQKGQFNVPFGRYAKLSVPDLAQLNAASRVLRTAEIVEGDYLDVLGRYAAAGDFVFLDPPYVPVGVYSDFKRYTKEQFTEDDHRNLAAEVRRLTRLGCRVLLTNSNHPLVHQLYEGFSIEIISTKRFINSKGNGRTGEDVLVTCTDGGSV